MDLGYQRTICSVSIAWYQGNTRQNYFTVSTSSDGTTYHQIYNCVSSGTTLSLESYTFPTTTARDVRVTVDGNTVNDWASITELQAIGAISAYDQMISTDHPVAYWGMNSGSNTEVDLTGNNNTGTYKGGLPGRSSMPNGDIAALFNGSGEYLIVPSKSSLSIPTTHNLTWEIWIKPTVLQFPNSTGGYVDFIGKCARYSPTCEWESRFYNTTNPEGRCNRLSAYAFNSTAGLGSAADWQPVCGLLQPGQWLHVVGEYTTLTEPATCPNASSLPGTIDIWVNGVKWDQAVHNPTGCMSQYGVKPQALSSPLNIATMATNTSTPTWFQGAIGKVAIYNYRLSQIQITNHYKAMTSKQPTGGCGNTCTF